MSVLMARRLSPATVSCYEPERLADKVTTMIFRQGFLLLKTIQGWHEVDAEDFACKPGAEVRIIRVLL